MSFFVYWMQQISNIGRVCVKFGEVESGIGLDKIKSRVERTVEKIIDG